MTKPTSPEREQIKGALEVLFTLKEEFAQWAEEAQDKSKKEALDNVLMHIENLDSEYHRRLHETSNG